MENKDKITEFLKKEWLKVGLLVIAAGLVFSYGFGKYTTWDKQKAQILIEQQKQEAEVKAEQEKIAKEEEEKEEAKRNLESCLSNASRLYKEEWNKECKYLGELSNKCKEILDITSDEYYEKYPEEKADNPIIDYFNFTEKQEDCSCRLLTSKADIFNERLKERKDECYKKYPQK